jgi:hypothetical protein
MKKIRIFISYSTKDKNKAGRLGNYLKSYFGTTVFLAHEEIEPSEAWKSRIVQELKASDLYVALLTKNFKRSNWTSQEAGIAFARKIKMVPLWVSVKPFGFMSDSQAKRVKISRPWEMADAVARGIYSIPALKLRFVDGFVDAFAASPDFYTTNALTGWLLKIEKYRKSQFGKLINGMLENDQIYAANKSKNELVEFVSRHKKKIAGPLWKKLCRRFEI